MLLGLLTGARSWSLKFLNPITYKLRETWEIWEGGSIFIRHQPEDDNPNEELIYLPSSYLLRSFWLTPFMPLILIPVGLLYWFHRPYLATSILLLIFLVVPALLVVVSYLATNGNGGRLVKKAWKGITNMFTSDKLWYLQQEDIQFITCNTNKSPLTYKSFPARRKTIGLRFQNLKTKVCKPFSV